MTAQLALDFDGDGPPLGPCVECGEVAGAVCQHCLGAVCWVNAPTWCGRHPCGAVPRGRRK
jgi:hypothetical protein